MSNSEDTGDSKSEGSSSPEVVDEDVQEDVRLIQLVQNFELIYDTTDPQFKDKDVVNEAWKYIGTYLKQLPTISKLRWNDIVAEFAKVRKEGRTDWKLFKYLRFLENYDLPNVTSLKRPMDNPVVEPPNKIQKHMLPMMVMPSTSQAPDTIINLNIKTALSMIKKELKSTDKAEFRTLQAKILSELSNMRR